MKKNPVDKRLEDKLMKMLNQNLMLEVSDDEDLELQYFQYQDDYPNLALIRKNPMDNKYNKYQEQVLMKLWKSLQSKLFHFWNFSTDINPKHCFICGDYIPVDIRLTKAVLTPYKKGESCHDYCWRKFMLPEYVTNTRITDESKLICFLEKGVDPETKETIGGKVCRERIKNTSEDLLAHFLTKHSDKELMFSHEDFKKVRSINCLKPNGQKFARVLN